MTKLEFIVDLIYLGSVISPGGEGGGGSIPIFSLYGYVLLHMVSNGLQGLES